MATEWYKGKVSRKRPFVTRELYIALDRATTDKEKDVVYSRLFEIAESAHLARENPNGFVSFYEGLPRRDALCASTTDETQDSNASRRGKELEARLKEAVLPFFPTSQSDPRYRAKMTRARRIEYIAILNFFDQDSIIGE